MTIRSADSDAGLSVNAMVERQRRSERSSLLSALALALLVVGSMAYCGVFDASRYADGAVSFAQLGLEALPPDFSRWRAWGWPLLETLAMSIAGTAIGGSIALLLSVFVARSTAPIPILGAVLRVLFNGLRSVPELVLGVILVASLGFGALAGVIALSVHSIGMLGRFFVEIIEHADRAPIDALRTQGASVSQTFCFGILPQILPRITDLLLYRWEHNLRAATVMGLVGAGGIGLEIITAMKLFEYREALALLIVTLGLVTTIDLVGTVVRRRFIGAN